MIKTIVIDDLKLQQDTLLRMIGENFDHLDIVSVCSSVEEGIEKITLHQPQLVFLDVELGARTGFDLLNELDEINFEVIFTTSFSKYAVDAFKVSAVDYLLKPYTDDDLKKAVCRFEERAAAKQPLNHLKILMENLNTKTDSKTKIALPTMGGYVFVQAGDIVRCEAEDHYTWFYFSDKSRKMVSKNLKDCEELLIPFNFFRIHLSHLINMNCIKEYSKNMGEGGSVKMSDGCTIEVSRKRKPEFLKLLIKP